MKENKKYKILLISPGEEDNLAIKGISSFLTIKGIDSIIISFSPEHKESVLKTIREINPSIIGFSLTYQRLFPDIAELIVYLRNHGIRAHFTMGGHFPTIESIRILQYLPELDSVIKGEGEITILELFKKLDQIWNWGNIEGLCFRDEMGKIKINTPRKLIENLDELPIPERTKIMHIGEYKAATLQSSRGCFYNCSYCSNHSFYSQTDGIQKRSRSPRSIVKEMEFLHYSKGVKIFNFDGDDFFVNTQSGQNWGYQFVEELKEKKLPGKIAWKMSCKINDIDKTMLSEFKNVGLISIFIEIESGNNNNLQAFNKRYSTEDLFRAIEIIDSINLNYEFSLALLNPFSTFETLKEDLNFLKKINKTTSTAIHFSKMMPYAGTLLFNQLAAEERLTGTFSYPNYSYTDNRLDLFELFIHKAFHYRNNSNDGLVNQLRQARFHHLLTNTFKPGIGYYFYNRNIRPLIKEANQQMIETLNTALEMMDPLSYDEILNYWPILDNIVESHVENEQHTTFLLNELMHYQINLRHPETIN